MRRIIYLLVSAWIVWPSFAFANDCGNINEDETWLNGLDAMKWGLENQDYDLTLDAGRSIYSICPSSPVYLYYLAKAFKAKGDEAKAREYIYKASDSTYEFATQPQISQLIWYERFELDHPEQSAKAVEELKNRVAELSEKECVDNVVVTDHGKDKLYVGTWAGAGVGISGLALTIVGAVLAAKDDEKIELKSRREMLEGEQFPHKIQSMDVKKTYTAGLALLGTGIGLTVAGSILTGIMGYQYTHYDEKPVTVSVGLNHVSFEMNF